MSAWNRLRNSFRSHLSTAAARRDFSTLRERHEPMRSFDGADELVGVLMVETDDPDAYADKDDLYRLLIREARTGGAVAATASAILWLASWLPLDRVYKQYARAFHDPDDAAGELAQHVTAAIMTMDLERVRFVASMLARTAMQETLRAAKREKRAQAGEASEATDHNSAVAEESELAWRERDPDAGLDVERLLANVSPRDRELLVRRWVLGESYAEIARRLGGKPGALRMRVLRMTQAIRDRAAAV